MCIWHENRIIKCVEIGGLPLVGKNGRILQLMENVLLVILNENQNKHSIVYGEI